MKNNLNNLKKDYLNNENLINENIKEYNLQILQDNRYFKYGTDSVLLAKFAYLCELNKKIGNKKKIETDNIFNIDVSYQGFKKRNIEFNYNIVDICSGTGIIGLIFSRFTNNDNIYFVEKQRYFCDINKENLKRNFKYFNNEIINEKVINSDIKDIKGKLNKEMFEVVLVNPPYMKNESGIEIKKLKKDIAKKEEGNVLENIFISSTYLLKNKGRMYLVHKPERLSDIFNLSRKHNMEAKQIKFILNKNKDVVLVLMQFIKNSKPGLKILKNNFLEI